jgi:hypothetical protein
MCTDSVPSVDWGVYQDLIQKLFTIMNSSYNFLDSTQPNLAFDILLFITTKLEQKPNLVLH